jgi:hypothetical protein
MPVIEGGVSASVAEVGVGSGIPLHVTGRPIPHGALGHYRIAATSGTIAAALAAAAQVFYVRWTDATRLMVVTRVKLSFQPLTLFTAATLTDFGFDLFKATSVSAGGGGTDLGALVKTRMRTGTMGASLLDTAGLMRISTTAALTALTTLDATAIAQSIGDTQRVNPAAATEEQRVNDPTLLFQPDIASGEHPLVLSQNEGLVLRNRTVWPAAGTGVVQVEMSWAEVTAY